jgi:hypothetical protein
MKTSRIIWMTLGATILLFPLNLNAENENPQKGMFDKNQMYTGIHNDLDVSFQNQFSDGNKYASAMAAAMGLTFTWFFINNSGLIAQLNYSRTLTNSDSNYGYRQITRDKMLYLGYIYGYQMSQSLGLYGSALLGIGAARNYFKYLDATDGNNTTSLSTGAKIELGAYWRPFLALPILFQPQFGYSFLKKAYDARNTVTSGLYISASIIAALTCNDFYCRNSSIARIMNPYTAGLIFITTGLNPFVRLGNITSKSNNARNNVDNYFNTGLRIGMGMYVIQNLAALVFFNSYANKTTHQNSGDGNRDSGLKLGFGLRYNLPVVNSCLNNIFAQAKIGFGNRVYKSLNGESNTNKDKLFLYSLGLGYAYFLTSYMALTSSVLYEVTRYTNRVSKSNTLDSGFAIRLALVFYISNLITFN